MEVIFDSVNVAINENCKNVKCEKISNRSAHYENSVSIRFEDVTYYVSQGFQREKKEILHKMNGTFNAGQLVCIIGPSGAGKTTLLNILSGFRTNRNEGTIYINGNVRNLDNFKKVSSYIGQDNHLQQLLSVRENLEFAIDLKLGPCVHADEKCAKVKHILRTLSLDECANSKVCSLSGGQQKRLSIGLELIDSPLVMFLDEPTTGLDSGSCSQCVKLLRKITRQGKTIICTLHQPSASVFRLFDNVYVMADGMCLYNGSTENLVPYLKSINAPCPQYYNPADHVIELACKEYSTTLIPKMTNTVENGKSLYWIEQSQPSANFIGLNDPSTGTSSLNELADTKKLYFFYEVKILLQREILKSRRSKKLFYVKLIVNLFISLMYASLYWQVGDHGGKVMMNYSFLICFLLHNTLSAMIPAILTSPNDISIVTKEHFNRWYSVQSYVITTSIIDLFLLAASCLVFTLTSYLMTGQPLEMQRIVMFTVTSILVACVAQSFGIMIGSFFNVVNGTFVGLSTLVPIMLLAGLGAALKNLPIDMYWASYLSYMKYGIEGLLAAIYGYDRPSINCPIDEYCHFKNPKKFISYLSIPADRFWIDIFGLCAMLITFRVTAFIVLKIRLS